jgi:hypothetical protein
MEEGLATNDQRSCARRGVGANVQDERSGAKSYRLQRSKRSSWSGGANEEIFSENSVC